MDQMNQVVIVRYVKSTFSPSSIDRCCSNSSDESPYGCLMYIHINLTCPFHDMQPTHGTGIWLVRVAKYSFEAWCLEGKKSLSFPLWSWVSGFRYITSYNIFVIDSLKRSDWGFLLNSKNCIIINLRKISFLAQHCKCDQHTSSKQDIRRSTRSARASYSLNYASFFKSF